MMKLFLSLDILAQQPKTLFRYLFSVEKLMNVVTFVVRVKSIPIPSADKNCSWEETASVCIDKSDVWPSQKIPMTGATT